jgi:Copper transport outer membrane protein, MctB
VFDFRYHVVSLAAVFLALVIGILVGIGLSGKGFVDDAERKNLEQEIADLSNELTVEKQTGDASTSRLLAMQDLADEVVEPLSQGRLSGTRVALLYIGAVPGPVNQAVRRGVSEAGGRIVKMLVTRVPYDEAAIGRALGGRPLLRAAEGNTPADIGRALGNELLDGGQTPLWKALDRPLVADRGGVLAAGVDAVVVARAVPPQRGPTEDFLTALYTAVGARGVPAVGVQEAGAAQSAVGVFADRGLSTVDSVDTSAGRLALVLVLAGADHGHYGVEETAKDGILPSLAGFPG